MSDKVTVGLGTILGLVITVGSFVASAVGSLQANDPFGLSAGTWSKIGVIAGLAVTLGRMLQAALLPKKPQA